MGAAPAGILQVLVTANTAQANAALSKVQAQMKATTAQSGAMAGGMKSMARSGALAAVAVAGAAIKMSTDFNQAMELIETQAGASRGEIAKLKSEVLKLAVASEHGPQELAEGLFRLESQGYRGARAMKALKVAADLASVGQANLEQTTVAVSAAVESGIKGTESFKKTAAYLNSAVGQSSMRLEDMVGALSTGILPAANTAGLALTDVTSALALMTRIGMPANSAATKLRMTMSLMEAPTDKAAEALERIGLGRTDLAKEMRKPDGLLKSVELLKEHLSGMSKVQQGVAISEIFGGGRSSGVIKALLNDTESLKQIYKDTAKGASEFDEKVAQQAETSSAKFKTAWSTVQTAMIALGSTLEGPVADAVEYMANTYTKMAETVGEWLKSKDGQRLMENLRETGKGIKWFFQNAVIPALKPLLPVLKHMALVIGDTLMAVADTVGWVFGDHWAQTWQSAKDWVKNAVGGMTHWLRTARDNIKGAFVKVSEIIIAPFRLAFKTVRSIITGFVDTILGGLSSVMGGIAAVADKMSGVPILGKKFKGLADGARGAQDAIDDLRGSLNETNKKGSRSVNNLSDNVRNSMDRAGVSFVEMGDRSRTLNKRVSGNSRSIAKATRGAMSSVGENTNEALKAFNSPKLTFGWTNGNERGTTPLFARGGLAGVVPGEGAGDRHVLSLNGNPIAKVESSEGIFVGNRNMMAGLSEMNSAMPRFAKGGIVALGKSLQRQGYQVGEHPAFGGVAPVHTAGSYHYSGQALDINHDQGNEVGALNSLYARLKNMPGVIELLWQVANHFDHLHVAMASGSGFAGIGGVTTISKPQIKGPDGPLKDIAQAGVDKATKAANKMLRGMGVEGAEGSMSADGDVERIFAQVAKRLSTSRVASEALGMAGYAESGMRDLNYGDGISAIGNTSRGALQLLSSTAARYGYDPHNEGQVASGFLTHGYYNYGGANKNAAAGYPAHLVAQRVQGSAFSDGSNYLAQAGRAQAWMKRFGLQEGGLAMLPGFKDGGSPSGGVAPGWKGVSKKEREEITKQNAAKKKRQEEAERKRQKAFMSQGKKQVSRVMEQFRKKERKIAALDEQISIAETLHALERSEAGSDLGPKEKDEQVGLQRLLVRNLRQWRDIASEGSDLTKKLRGKKRGRGKWDSQQDVFRQAVVDAQGVTGKGGRIFDTRMALAGLNAPESKESSGPGGFSISDVLQIAEAARYNVFDAMPRAHTGARIVGPTGGETAVMVQAGETISPAGSAPTVNITFENGMEWLRDFVKVEVENDAASRHQTIRAGVR